MIITPRISEKTYAASAGGVYTFDVPLDANIHQIALAVSSKYDVKVADVRVVVSKGKSVRGYRGKRAAPVRAHRKDTKKAYVTLVKGESIDIYTSEEQN